MRSFLVTKFFSACRIHIRKSTSILTIVFITVLLLGQISRAQFLPIGEREGFTGNAGVGRVGSAGNVLYNPAGLAGNQQDKISASAVSFSSSSIDVTGPNVNDTSIKAFSAIPTTISSSFKTGDGVVALSILTPVQYDLSFQTTGIVAGVSTPVDSLVKNQRTEIFFGPSYAIAISNELALGVSIFGVKRDEYRISSSYFQPVDRSQTFLATEQRRTDLYGAVLIAGAVWRVASETYLGLSVSPPGVSVGGVQRYDLKAAYYNNGTNSSPEVQKKQYRATYHKPIYFTSGLSHRLSSNTHMFLDIGALAPGQYQDVVEDEQTKVDNGWAGNANTGLELTFGAHVFAAGFSYQQDGAKKAKQVNGGAFAWTAGYVYTTAHVESGFGAFWTKSESEFTDGSGRVSTTVYGGNLTTSYRF